MMGKLSPLRFYLLPAQLFLIAILLLFQAYATVNMQVNVHLQPEREKASLGETLTVKVYVNPNGVGISAGEFHIACPANVFRVLEVKVGELFGEKYLVGLNETKIMDGNLVILFAAARVGETLKPTPPSIALTIKLNILEEASSGSYTIKLLKADLVDESFNRIPNVKVHDCTVTIEAPTPTPTSTSTVTATPITAKITVLVLDEASGKPLANVRVEVDGRQALTDAGGRASFTVEEGAYTVKASLEDYEGKSVTVKTVQGEETYVELRLKPLGKPGGGCLIATAAFGSELAPQVQALRTFRNQYVLATRGGLAFINTFNAWYYAWSPTVAEAERNSPVLKAVVKWSIYPLLAELEVAKKIYQILAFNPEIAILAAGLVASMLIALTYLAPPALLALALLRGRIRLHWKLTAELLASFIILHLVSLQTVSWLLSVTAPAIVLLTLTLTLQAVVGSLKSFIFKTRS